ncbi:MAG: nickel-responsive transcriptional regulator NikR [Natronomonas sp.]
MSDSSESELERVSLTVPGELIEELDGVVEELEYPSRSKAARDALRLFLADERWRQGETTQQGSIVVVYNHDAPDVNDELLRLQHGAEEAVVATQHVHFDTHRCLETIVVDGASEKIRRLVDGVRTLDGVETVRFTPV